MSEITGDLAYSDAGGFNLWLERMGYTQVKAAEELGLTPNTIYNYIGNIVRIPKCVVLACEALELRRKRTILRQYTL
jgi:predicted transcriptional regulator